MTIRFRWAVTAAMVVLAACVSPANQPAADATFAQDAKSGRIAAGRSRVYVFLGTLVINGHERDNPSASDFFINGVDVGGVNRGECMVIDLAPGTYVLSSKERSSNPPPVQAVTVTLEPGSPLYLAIDVGITTGPVLPGAIPTLVAQSNAPPPATGALHPRNVDGPQRVHAMKIVLPDEAAMRSLVVR